MDLDDITFMTCYMLGDMMIKCHQRVNMVDISMTNNSLIFKIFLGWWMIHNKTICNLKDKPLSCIKNYSN